MRTKRPERVLGSDLIQRGQWNGIKVSVVQDDRSSEEVQAADRAIWRKARIWERPQGFSLVLDGRVVSVCFRRDDRLVSFAAEIAGTPALDIVIFDDVPDAWIDLHTLQRQPISREEQVEIRAGLIDWLAARGTRFSVGGVVDPHRG